MAKKNMSGMGDMPGMNIGEKPSPPAQASSPFMDEGMKNMPQAMPKRVWTVTGTEDWNMLRGFGPAARMVAMMNGMMFGSGPMQNMKMGRMDMGMAEMPAPTPEQARTAADTPAATGPAPDGTQVTMTVASGTPQVGDNTALVTVTDAAGKPVTGATITSTVAMTTMDMGTTHPAFQDVGGGKYQGKIAFAMAGPWRVSLHVNAPGRPPVVKDFVLNAQ